MDRLVVLLTKLAAAFPRDNPTETTLAVYVEQLSTLDFDVLSDVIHGCISSSHRFPTIAEIREAYRQRRIRDTAKGTTALPIGRPPMPEKVKAQWAEMRERMDERAEALKPPENRAEGSAS